jgi:hypothetical protein
VAGLSLFNDCGGDYQGSTESSQGTKRLALTTPIRSAQIKPLETRTVPIDSQGAT